MGTTRQQAAGEGNGPITFSQRIRKQSVLGVELDHELAQPVSSAVLPQQARTPQKFSNSATPWRRHLQIHGSVGEHFLFKPQVSPVSNFLQLQHIFKKIAFFLSYCLHFNILNQLATIYPVKILEFQHTHKNLVHKN